MAQDSAKLKDMFNGDASHEDSFTKSIEKQTAKIPSVGFLGLALGAMALSITLEIFSRRRDPGAFVGIWVPTFLLLGLYNKLVKVEGSDKSEKYAA